MNRDAVRIDTLPKRLLKLIIALLILPLLELWRLGHKLAAKPMPSIAVVIYYHQVPVSDRARFGSQMDMLLRWAVPMRADDPGPLSPGSRCAIITFDDAWQSFKEVAFPELERRHIPVTLFAISGKLGQVLEADCTERLMTEDELRSVADSVTIGSHTDSHARLPGLDLDQARSELRQSREKLSRLTNQEVKLFCFPYGAADSASIRLCREWGYARVFTGVPEIILRWPNQFAFGRVRVDPSDWSVEFFLKIRGAYFWMSSAIRIKTQVREVLRNTLAIRRSMPRDETV